MKRMLSLSLAVLTLISVLAGCASKPSDGSGGKELTAEERSALYKTAIENARSAEDNEYMPVISSADDEMAAMLLDLLGLKAEDMSAFAISASAMNVRAYGIAVVYPAADKAAAVREGLQGFVDNQKQNFEQYLQDQYEVASNARLETLDDGTIVLVMSDGQDEIFTSIKDTVEAGPAKT